MTLELWFFGVGIVLTIGVGFVLVPILRKAMKE